MNVSGFSTKWRTPPVRSSTTSAPYADGRSERVTRTVPSRPFFTWRWSRSRSGYAHSTSELTTKNGESFVPPSVISASAFLSGPAVPSAADSFDTVIFSPSADSHWRSASSNADEFSARDSCTQTTTSETPASFSACSWCISSVLLQNSRSGRGRVKVSGRMCV